MYMCMDPTHQDRVCTSTLWMVIPAVLFVLVGESINKVPEHRLSEAEASTPPAAVRLSEKDDRLQRRQTGAVK